MNELRQRLAGLPEELRRELAHELAAALAGRTAGRHVPVGGEAPGTGQAPTPSAGEGSPASSETMGQTGGESPPLPAKPAALQAVEAGRVSTQGEEVPLREPRSYAELLPPAEEAARGVTVTHGSGGKTVTLRREPGGLAAAAAKPEQGSERGQDGADARQQMREISRYFCQDSRRYDSGFTRY